MPLDMRLTAVYVRRAEGVKLCLANGKAWDNVWRKEIGMTTRTTVDSRLKALEAEVEALRSEVARLTSLDAQAVTLRTISRDDAKAEVLALFQSGRTLYYSDIVGELGIDIDSVVDVCEELEKQGRIETIGDSEGERRQTRRRTDIRRGKKNPKVASG